MALHFISEQQAYSFITASPHLCPLPYRRHTQRVCVCVFGSFLERLPLCLFPPECKNLPTL